MISAVVIVLASVLIFSLLPMAGFDSDVGKVGQGRPAVVLAFENYAPASMDTMDAFSRVRRDYAEQIEFLVADLGTPRGRAFVERNNAFTGQVMTFSGDGTRVRVELLDGGEQALRDRLQQDLGL